MVPPNFGITPQVDRASFRRARPTASVGRARSEVKVQESVRSRGASKSGRADALAHGSGGSIEEEEIMDKRRAQRRQRVANKVGNLSAATVDRTEAERVVGGD